MKRDMELIRKILFHIEENYVAGQKWIRSITIDGYEDAVVTELKHIHPETSEVSEICIATVLCIQICLQCSGWSATWVIYRKGGCHPGVCVLTAGGHVGLSFSLNLHHKLGALLRWLPRFTSIF